MYSIHSTLLKENKYKHLKYSQEKIIYAFIFQHIEQYFTFTVLHYLDAGCKEKLNFLADIKEP